MGLRSATADGGGGSADQPPVGTNGGQQQDAGPGQQQRTADAPPASWEEIFQHDRFKQLVDRAKKAEAALEKTAKDREAAEQAKLLEEKRFQEAFEKERARAAHLEQDLQGERQRALNERKARAVQDAARAHEPPFSAQALQDVTMFVDLAVLEVGEDGKVKGAEQAIKELAKNRPYMLEAKRQDPGSPAARRSTGPAKTSGTPRTSTL